MSSSWLPSWLLLGSGTASSETDANAPEKTVPVAASNAGNAAKPPSLVIDDALLTPNKSEIQTVGSVRVSTPIPMMMQADPCLIFDVNNTNNAQVSPLASNPSVCEWPVMVSLQTEPQIPQILQIPQIPQMVPVVPFFEDAGSSSVQEINDGKKEKSQCCHCDHWRRQYEHVKRLYDELQAKHDQQKLARIQLALRQQELRLIEATRQAEQKQQLQAQYQTQHKQPHWQSKKNAKKQRIRMRQQQHEKRRQQIQKNQQQQAQQQQSQQHQQQHAQ